MARRYDFLVFRQTSVKCLSSTAITESALVVLTSVGVNDDQSMTDVSAENTIKKEKNRRFPVQRLKLRLFSLLGSEAVNGGGSGRFCFC